MKKVFGILAITIVAVVVFFTTNTADQTTALDIKSVMSLNSANAECRKGPIEFNNDGRCSGFLPSSHCFYTPYPEERNCDPSLGWD